MTESRRHAISNASLTPTVIGESEEHRSTESSKRFRETIESIPSPEEELHGRRPKPYTPSGGHLILILGVPLCFIGFGIALGIATNFSNQSGGFRVPTVNVFGALSGQFLSSIIPTIIITPFAIVYRLHDWQLRSFQPYVVLRRGDASAEEALLLDYVNEGPFFAIFHAMRWKHRIVLLSSFTAFVSFAFQPLAGSIFQIRQTPQIDKTHVTSQEYISLADNIDQLNDFLASAGYVNAAALYNLGDPPFVFGNWSTAAFQFPVATGMNETVELNTTAITNKANCANPAGQTTQLAQVPDDPNSFTLTSTSLENCTPFEPVSINITAASQQYGVVDVNCPDNTQDDPNFHPVMFWFINSQSNPPDARTVFCAPTLLAFNVTATAHLADGTLDSCFISGDFNKNNNVTGPPLNGTAFNGLIFKNSSDPFVTARALAIASGISGTILRTASNQPGGLEGVFGLANGMLDFTSKIYTQHLATSARAIYFRNDNSSIPAEKTSLLPRLWIDPLPAYFLAACSVILGIIGVVVRFINHLQRRNLILAAPPGSIASITALTARSGFGELLLPYDTQLQLEKKLEGIKFRLDQRTGAIVADEVTEGVPGMGRDDAMLSLLGKHNERLSQHSSSSQAAYQSAVGYPPWVSKTPYDRLQD